jgi:hypothetical protein
MENYLGFTGASDFQTKQKEKGTINPKLIRMQLGDWVCDPSDKRCIPSPLPLSRMKSSNLKKKISPVERC